MHSAIMKVIWKKMGQTPLRALEELREQDGVARSVPMTYAGRLDPLAEGKLILLEGEECKRKKKYLGLDKEYEFEVLLGASSDTGDVMGMVEYARPNDILPCLECREVKKVIRKYVGRYECRYPEFSSKTVKGKKTGETKPLFLWSLEGRLDEIELPAKDVEIYKMELLGIKKLNKEEVLKSALAKIATVPRVMEESKRLGADFRREQVLQSWHKWARGALAQSMWVVKFRVVCSSGTYVRTLARDIAKEFGTVGLAWSIKRTKVGKYVKLWDRFGFWLERY